MSTTPVLAASSAAIVGVGLLDYATGVDVRLFPLYFVPLAMGTYRAGKVAGVALTAICTAVWIAANLTVAGEAWSGAVATINATAQTVAFATIAVLISKLRHRLDHERSLSRVDPLTGLHNKRAFEERASMLVEVARRTRRPFTLAYADLDNFKQLNDSRGHQAGDAALLVASDLLRTHLRQADVVARLGGDEFAVLMSDCDRDGAERALRRLRAAAGVAMRGRGWPVTMSLGAVCFHEPPPDLAAAVAAADALMYRAKRAGKDRLCVEEHPSASADAAGSSAPTPSRPG